VLIIETKIL